MNITLNIEAGNPGELQEAIIGLAGMVNGSALPQVEKPKRGSQGTTKPEKQQDTKSDSKPVEDPKTEEETTGDTAETETGTGTEEVPTVVELRAKAQEKGTTPEGKKAIKELLVEFESKSISDVPEEKRTAFLHKLEAL